MSVETDKRASINFIAKNNATGKRMSITNNPWIPFSQFGFLSGKKREPKIMRTAMPKIPAMMPKNPIYSLLFRWDFNALYARL